MQVDKDFVWSLWKQAQQELPDVSAIIDMVVAQWITAEFCTITPAKNSEKKSFKKINFLVLSILMLSHCLPTCISFWGRIFQTGSNSIM